MGKSSKRTSAIVTMLCFIILLMPFSAAADTYSDIKNHWNKATIESWTDKGYVSGYADGNFKPDRYITRAEFMTLVNKAFNFTNTAPIDYFDVDPEAWYANAVSRAKAAGYISGYPDGTIKPDNPISREEAASIIMRLKNLAPDEAVVNDFSDSVHITWSKGAVGAIAKAGIMKGYPDGTFLPRKNITRAEAVAALNRALGSPADTPVVPINISTITGIKVPVKGAVPVSTLEDAKQFTATISWLPADTIFAANTVYTATIEITPKPGYTLKGVPANSFTVEGAETTNPADSGNVTAIFPRTGASNGGGGGGGGGGSYAPPIVINNIENLSLIAGVTAAAAVVTLPADAAVTAVSSDINVAAVSVADHDVIINGIAEGTATITVTATKSGYKNGTRTFSITVIAREVTGVAVKDQPAKLSYVEGQSLDLAGLSATLTWNDKSTEDVLLADFTAKGITVNPESGTTLTVTEHNNKSVALSCNGQTANTSNLTVVPRGVTGIAVKTQPAKLSYVEGQSLDLTGLSATLTWNDESTEDVLLAGFAAKGITIDPADGTTLTVADHNNKPVALTCNGQTAGSANLTVIPKELAGIAVKTQPLKTTYYVGQSLDLTGLEVTLTYNDAATEDAALTDFAAYGISVSPGAGTVLAITDAEVTITVNGKTTKQPITVNPITLTADTTWNDVDHEIDITFGAGAVYANAITGVSFNGVDLTVNKDYTVSSDKVTLKPAGRNPALTTPATANVVIKAAGYGDAGVMQTITAGVYNSIEVTTQPVPPGTNGDFFATQPVLTIYDRYGNICADGRSSTASVYAHAGGGSGQWQMYGTLRQNAAAGVVTYTDLQCRASRPGTISILFELEGTPYTATSFFTLPDIDILGFKAIADVDAGTAGYTDYADATAVQAVLPTSVQTKSFSILEDYHINVPVTAWEDTGTYNPSVAGRYTFTAILGTFPAGYANSGGYTATVEVVVSAAADLTEYLAAINAVNEEGYTTASWTTYQSVVDANVVTAKNTQAQVDAARDNILAAQANLVARSVMGGTVSITGAAKFGETLQADIAGITYTPATSDNVLTYQWKRDGGNISGETADTYTITAADIGKVILVTVSADGDHAIGSLTSATSPVDKAEGPAAPEPPTAAIVTTTSITLAANPLHEFSTTGGASWQDSEVFTGLTPSTAYTFLARVKETATHKASAPSAANLITTNAPSIMSGSVVITGIEKFGWELSADISGITFDPPTSDNVFSYQWYREDAPIDEATESSYTLTEADIGRTLTFRVSADGLNAAGSISSAATGVIAKADGPAAPEQDIRATYPVETTMIDLKNLPTRAAGLEAAVAIDGINFEPYFDLSVSSTGEVRITGLTGVSTSSVVKIRVKETATVLAGEDKEIAVNEAGVRDRGPSGGFIFYDKGSYSDGWRYIEAAGVNAGSSIYSDVNYMPTGGSGTGIGTGRSNTDLIISRTSVSAAKMCDDWSWGGKDDWFLPSRDELAAMCSNLHQYGLEGFDDYWYWSSSEYIDNYGTVRPDLAWVILFDNNSASCYQKSLYPWRVRAARYL